MGKWEVPELEEKYGVLSTQTIHNVIIETLNLPLLILGPVHAWGYQMVSDAPRLDWYFNTTDDSFYNMQKLGLKHRMTSVPYNILNDLTLFVSTILFIGYNNMKLL